MADDHIFRSEGSGHASTPGGYATLGQLRADIRQYALASG